MCQIDYGPEIVLQSPAKAWKVLVSKDGKNWNSPYFPFSNTVPAKTVWDIPCYELMNGGFYCFVSFAEANRYVHELLTVSCFSGYFMRYIQVELPAGCRVQFGEIRWCHFAEYRKSIITLRSTGVRFMPLDNDWVEALPKIPVRNYG